MLFVILYCFNAYYGISQPVEAFDTSRRLMLDLDLDPTILGILAVYPADLRSSKLCCRDLQEPTHSNDLKYRKIRVFNSRVIRAHSKRGILTCYLLENALRRI